MRIRGRRVALLLAGVLPLLAYNDLPMGPQEERLESAPAHEEDEHDRPPPGPAEALHDDSLSSLPALHLDLHKLENGEEEQNVKTADGSPEVDDSSSSSEEGAIADHEGESSSASTGETTATEISVEEIESTEEAAKPDASVPSEEEREAMKEPPTVEDSDQESLADSAADNDQESPVDSAAKGTEEKEPPVDSAAETIEEKESPADSAAETAREKIEVEAPAQERQEVAPKSSVDEEGDAARDETAKAMAEATEETTTEMTATATAEATAKDTVETQASGDDEEDGPIERLVVDYASKSVGALILEKSPSMKGTSNLLHSDRDKYAIAPCEDKKFVVVGLSEDILVKRVRLANYERYSSPVKDFQIMGSQDMQTWADLGTYTAVAKNGEQAFDLEEPSWARYLKFRFLSHHGSEHYCTVSQIKVHGSTMLQGFQEQWRESEAGGQEPEDVEAEAKGGELKQEETAKPTQEERQPSEEKEESTAHKPSDSERGTATTETSHTQHSETESREKPDTLGTVGTEESAPSAATGDKAVDSEASSKKEQEATQKQEDSAAACDSDKEAAACDSVSSSTSSSSESQKLNEEDGTAAPNALDESANILLEKNERQTARDWDCQVSKDAGNCSANLPDALLGFSFLDVGKKSETLSFASIGLSSHKPANEERSSAAEHLDTSAISSPSSVAAETESANDNLSELLSETVKELQAKTADAVKEIQEKIRSSIGGSHIGSAITRLSSMSELDHSEEDKVADSASTPVGNEGSNESGASHPKSTSKSDLSSDDEVQLSPDALNSEQQPIVEAESPPQESEDSKVKAAAEGSVSAPVDAKDGTQIGVNSRAAEDVNRRIEHVLKRIPSAECLEAMNYQEFKAKVASNTAGAMGGTASGPGKMKPIFETLTDQIKALQINQSVHDQFTKALVSCYQRVLLDVAAELESVHLKQDIRLSLLEESLRDIKAERESSTFRRVASPLVGLCSLILLWVTAALRQVAGSAVNFVSAATVALHAYANSAVYKIVSFCLEFLSICRSKIVIVRKDGTVTREIELDGEMLCMAVAASICVLVVMSLASRRARGSLPKTNNLRETTVALSREREHRGENVIPKTNNLRETTATFSREREHRGENVIATEGKQSRKSNGDDEHDNSSRLQNATDSGILVVEQSLPVEPIMNDFRDRAKGGSLDVAFATNGIQRTPLPKENSVQDDKVKLDLVTPDSKSGTQLLPAIPRHTVIENDAAGVDPTVSNQRAEHSVEQEAEANRPDSATDDPAEVMCDGAPRTMPALVPLE